MKVKLTLYCLIFLFACSSPKSKLDIALEQSADNRHELESVLTYFSKYEADSLHLKSARFLIENMPGHYSWDSDELYQYRKTVDSIHPEMSSVVKKVVYSIPWHSDLMRNEGNKVEDIKTITSEFLINHINNAVAMWQQCPWLESYSFEDFCEYLLPYRLGDEPMILPDSTQYWWKNVGKSIVSSEYFPYMLDEVRHFQRELIGIADNTYFPRLDIGSINQGIYTMDCLDVCYYDVIGFRQAGIPATIDLIPHWPYRNGRHYWRSIPDPACMNDNYSETLNPLAGKVYRMTYSHNPIPVYNGKDSIPYFFQNPFVKDVSEKYMKTSDIEIEIKRKWKNYHPEHIYLSVFNDLEWKPIAWSINKGNKAIFPNMGRNVVYLPVCYRGKRMKCVDYPFYLDKYGNIKQFIPDKEDTVSFTLNRKYPITYSKLQWGKSLKGCVLEASDLSDFAKTDTLGIIQTDNPELNWQEITVKTAKKYRYWRISKKGRPVVLAELRFISSDGEIIEGETISSGHGESNNKAFDHNPLTYHNYFHWVGYDMKSPKSVNKVRYLPRTDYNGIIPGHLYQLLYFDGNGWEEIDMVEAVEQEITFHHVPSNALYWLRNLTEGKEERIFTYQDNKMIFY